MVKNAQKLAGCLQKLGYKLVTDGTENHIVWVDLRSFGLNGSKSEFTLESVSIACNKNTGKEHIYRNSLKRWIGDQIALLLKKIFLLKMASGTI